MAQKQNPTSSGLPCVVQVGFAGARELLGPEPPDGKQEQLLQEIQASLVKILQALPTCAKLTPESFLCGISQIAIGADVLFATACSKLAIDHRIFLPQHRHDYLKAVGSGGAPDFTAAQHAHVESLLNGPSIIEERVVSNGPDRETRFHETNLEILHASDVIIGMYVVGALDKPGGTAELLKLAETHHKPAIHIEIDGKTGAVNKCDWHRFETFAGPVLPKELSQPISGDASTIGPYCSHLRRLASGEANWSRKLFRIQAIGIIAAHIVATVLATAALVSHPFEASERSIIWLLAFELIFLLSGLVLHFFVHHKKTPSRWALSRLIAEITRSIQAFSEFHVDLDHLLRLHVPDRLHPLLRTLNVLHLKSIRSHRGDPWEFSRNEYLNRRIKGPTGQLAYYEKEQAKAKFRQTWIPRAFYVFSSLAVGATAGKLLMISHAVSLPGPSFHWTEVLGALAITLPVIAVGFLSAAASMDLEARIQTYEEILNVLKKQVLLLDQASSASDFHRHLLETESRLLAETLAWFSRRSFTGVV